MSSPKFWCLSLAVLIGGLVVVAPVQAGPQETGAVGSAEALGEAVRSSDGVVRFEFSARAGVRGDGSTWNFSRDLERETAAGRRWARSCPNCTNGPIRVMIQVADGAETRVSSQVGGEWRKDGRDLGVVPPTAAAGYLLALVEHSGPEPDADSKQAALQAAVSGSAAIAWPRLMAVARDRAQDEDVRKAALFWTAHEAGSQAAADIEQIAVSPEEETEVQEAAVFALSQLPGERGTNVLLRLARENRNPDIVQTVYFWLGQREDPRVIELFEEILLAEPPR